MDALFLTSRRHWWEQVNSTVIEVHLSNTSRSTRAQNWIARLVDRDSNDCYFPAPRISAINVLEMRRFIHIFMFFTLMHVFDGKLGRESLQSVVKSRLFLSTHEHYMDNSLILLL